MRRLGLTATPELAFEREQSSSLGCRCRIHRQQQQGPEGVVGRPATASPLGPFQQERASMPFKPLTTAGSWLPPPLPRLLTAAPAEARDQIRIVGSSTVYPFTTAVAEQFGKTSGMKTPVVESTGTGGGMKLFCAGVGDSHPDVTNASRAHEEERIRGLPEERRQGHRRDQDRLRRPHHRAVEAGHADQADARRSSSSRSPRKFPGRTASSSPTPTRTGRTSTRRCRTSRSKCSARRRPPARATRSIELFMEQGAEQIPALAALQEVRSPRRSSGPGSRSAKTAPMSKPARTTT